MRNITQIVVHCSASPDFQNIGFKEINQWHLDKGWKGPSGVGCGYHWIIRRNGVVETGRMPNEKGAHVQGHNANSVGICLIGTHEFDQSQFTSLKRIIEALKEEFPGATVHEHREFDTAKVQGKTCPNFSVHDVLNV